jgi:hypothetical protein
MLFFDLDGCDMPREKVADLLDAQCVLCNTASSHTYMNTRLAATLERMRLVVFANANMTPETYEMVGRQIANYLNEKAAAQGYKLGLDPSKLHRGTMMYLPRHAESYMYDPCASFFIDRTVHRQPLDIAPWIEAAQEEMHAYPSITHLMTRHAITAIHDTKRHSSGGACAHPDMAILSLTALHGA